MPFILLYMIKNPEGLVRKVSTIDEQQLGFHQMHNWFEFGELRCLSTWALIRYKDVILPV